MNIGPKVGVGLAKGWALGWHLGWPTLVGVPPPKGPK